MRLKRALDGVRVFDDFVKCPSLAESPVFKGVSSKEGRKGGRFSKIR
jgi:hypothetical protein